MVEHSLRVGRALRQAGRDDVCVFGGYCHDVIEDLRHVDADTLCAIAEVILGDGNDASDAIALVHSCSYTADEYGLEKSARKAAAVARWLASTDPRVHQVKKADVEDNRRDCAMVSAEFERAYLSWALPLLDGLTRMVEARDRATGRTSASAVGR